MKLQNRISRHFHSLSLVAFLISIMVFIFVLKIEVNRDIHKELLRYKNLFERYTIKNKQFPTLVLHQCNIQEISRAASEVSKYGKTEHLDSNNKKNNYDFIKFEIKLENKNYSIKILKLREKYNNLIYNMVLYFTILNLIVMAVIFILNRFTLSKAWSGFYDTIKKIESYKINEKFELKGSYIKEFKILNNVLKNMTSKIEEDYLNLKEFTENTSHEIQTPLSIIRSKLELVLQTENLNDEQIKDVVAAYEAANRLSKLNTGLILLAKIDNMQFKEVENVDISDIVFEQYTMFEDIIQSKAIKVIRNIKTNISLSVNKELAIILIQNLVKNAVLHVNEKGTIEIELNNMNLIIKNTGKEMNLKPESIFNRFTNSGTHKSSTGLGLSIVKKICELYKFDIKYSYKDNQHEFKLLIA